MDDKKKAILAFGLIGAVVLGWGSYFLFLRDSGGPATTDTAAAATGPRVRQQTVQEEPKKAVTRRAATREKPQVEQPTRRERAPQEVETSKPRERKRTDTEEKKKKITPAA
ncbi:MAG TPA: hypothetical protein PKK06_04925 [Phycisphaerae bacterium]|nr:hypothetical protein [Phycisphaerae bacterium]HNU45183.1 hypothetical protein [Phycisphaerae bacterium]